MHKKHISLVSFLLALVLFVTAGCNGKKPEQNTSSATVDIQNPSSSDSTASEPENIDVPPDDAWEVIGSDDGYETPDDSLDMSMLEVSLTNQNASAPIQSDFLGFNAVYHAFTFRDDSNYGRSHTARSAKAELDAAQKSGINIARTVFDANSAWNMTTQSWDWESSDMKALYRWCLELKERGIDVWISYFYAFKELYPQYISYEGGTTHYAQGTKPSYFYVEGDQQKTFDRFSGFIDELVRQLFSHGCTNAKYLGLSTEPGFVFYEYENKTPEQLAQRYAEEFMGYSNAVHRKLTESKLRQNITIIGPNEGASTTPNGYMMKACYNMDREGAIDLYSCHSYNRDSKLEDDSGIFWHEDFGKKLDGFGGGPDQLIIDEGGYTNEGSYDRIRINNPFFGTNIAMWQVTQLNYGIRSSFIWTLFDQQWPNNDATNNDSFENGVQYCGLLPNFIVSSVPRPAYYAFSTIANYLGVEGSKIYACDYGADEGVGVYMSMSELPDGNISVVVVNACIEKVKVYVNFEKAIGKTLYRHLYNPSDITPDETTHVIPAGAKISKPGTGFTDILPAYGITVYTTVS